MRPATVTQTETTISNLPHVDGDHARLSNYLDDFIQGFADYAEFLGRQTRATSWPASVA